MGEAVKDKHYRNNDGTPREFDATTIRSLPDFSWMMLDLASQLRRLGAMVDEANLLAQTDVVSQLPNQRTAMLAMKSSLQQAANTNEPLAIMLFDGDNLCGNINEISYEAGDEAIRQLGSTLKGLDAIRITLPVGEQAMNLIILPGTSTKLPFKLPTESVLQYNKPHKVGCSTQLFLGGCTSLPIMVELCRI